MNALRFLLLLVFSTQIAWANNVDTFAAANESYGKRDFGAAISGYETLIRRGENRPEVFYNLGLAYERSLNPAKAILNFERAQILKPGFADAQIRSEALGNAPTRWWEQLPRFGSDLSLTLAVCAAWLVVLSLVAYWRVLGNVRHFWTMQAVLGLVIGVIAATSFYLRDWPLASSNRAIVLKSEKLRSNFTANSPSILSLKPGQSVEITSVNGPWTECRLPDETRGWVATSSLERVGPQS